MTENKVTVKISKEFWTKLNSARQPNETLDEAGLRLLDDRERFKKRIMVQGGTAL